MEWPENGVEKCTVVHLNTALSKEPLLANGEIMEVNLKIQTAMRRQGKGWDGQATREAARK